MHISVIHNWCLDSQNLTISIISERNLIEDNSLGSTFKCVLIKHVALLNEKYTHAQLTK